MSLDQLAREALPAPTATRLRRPGWRDPRLLAGLLLVVGAIALGSSVISSARDTTPIYAAAHVLPPGTVLTENDLAAVDVNLADAAERYLASGTTGVVGSVVTRTIAAGELLPSDAVSANLNLDLRAVAIPAPATLASTIVPGSPVDLWLVPKHSGTQQDAQAAPPRELATGLIVSEMTGNDGAMRVSSDRAVHVLVPSKAIADVLAALASDGTVSLVPAPVAQ